MENLSTEDYINTNVSQESLTLSTESLKSGKYKFYHVSGSKFDKLMTRNMLGTPITVNHFTRVDYNDTVSLFIGKPTLKEINNLRKAGFKSFGKPSDPMYIYEVDLELESKNIDYLYLTSTREKHEFLRDNKELPDDEFVAEKLKYYKRIGYKDEFDSIQEFEKCRYKYNNFSKDVEYQIKEAKKDSSLYEYYAACIPHLMIAIKNPIPIKLIETNQSDVITLESEILSTESKEPNMIIFGESHFQQENVDYINQSILDYKPDVILHELLDNQMYNKSIAEKLIKDNKIENDSGSYIKDILEVIITLNCKAYGIDRRDDETAKSKVGLALSFQRREEAMVNNIIKYKSGRTAVVVGDTHLRIEDVKELGGSSPIYKKYKNDSNVIIVRSKNREVDVKTNVNTEYNISREDLNLTTEAKKPKSPKRQKAESTILKYIDKIVTGGTNTKLYQELFDNMDDNQFHKFMEDLRDKKTTLSVIVPNGDSKHRISVENNIKLANELGFDFFQHLKVGKSEFTPAYTTPNKYMILKLPVRRAAQILTKKISIPQHTNSRDMLSGQVTNKSKGSKLTNPELQVLIGLGLKDSIVELMKDRGGDLGSGKALEGLLFKHGQANQALTSQYSTEVVSKKTLKAYFNCMHVKNTL